MKTNHILLSVNTKRADYLQVAAYIRAICILKEWETDISPFDVDAREHDNRWLLSVVYNGNKANLTLLSYDEFAGYGNDGHHTTIVSNFVKFLEEIKVTFKYA